MSLGTDLDQDQSRIVGSGATHRGLAEATELNLSPRRQIGRRKQGDVLGSGAGESQIDGIEHDVGTGIQPAFGHCPAGAIERGPRLAECNIDPYDWNGHLTSLAER